MTLKAEIWTEDELRLTMEILAEAVFPTLTEPKLRLLGEITSAPAVVPIVADPPHPERANGNAEQVKSSRNANDRSSLMARDRLSRGKLSLTVHLWPTKILRPNRRQNNACISYASTNIQGNRESAVFSTTCLIGKLGESIT